MTRDFKAGVQASVTYLRMHSLVASTVQMLSPDTTCLASEQSTCLVAMHIVPTSLLNQALTHKSFCVMQLCSDRTVLDSNGVALCLRPPKNGAQQVSVS